MISTIGISNINNNNNNNNSHHSNTKIESQNEIN